MHILLKIIYYNAYLLNYVYYQISCGTYKYTYNNSYKVNIFYYYDLI
jgi:hypothetical protein